jgi:hypothetical protein
MHVLIWGIYDEGPNGMPSQYSDDPVDFMKELRQKTAGTVEEPHVRWLPTVWECATEGAASRNPVVHRSVWIALSEIDKPQTV